MALDNGDIWKNTAWSKTYYDDAVKNYQKLINDDDKIFRIKKQWCLACWYVRSHMACSSCTKSNCEICNKEMMFGSTLVHSLCNECAKKYNLCTRCASDIEMKKRRKPWLPTES